MCGTCVYKRQEGNRVQQAYAKRACARPTVHRGLGLWGPVLELKVHGTRWYRA